MIRRLWTRFLAWKREAFPCMTEYWTPGGPISVPCDAYWEAHERELEAIRRHAELCRERVTRPDYV